MFYGGPDPITLNKMQGLVNNVRSLTSNPRRGTGDLDPRRNLNDECGYPSFMSPQDFKDLIDREPIAGLVNAIYSLESWKVQYEIWEDDDEEVLTEFEEDVYHKLPSQLNVEPSYFASNQKGNLISEFLMQADMHCGYGRYGIMLIGVNDGKPLSEPCLPSPNNELTFLRSFPEHLATIQEFESDRNKRRYGLPNMYQVTFSDPDDQSGTGMNENYTSEQVHWSRVIHVVDRWHHPSTSTNFGKERLWPVLNPVLDIRKTRASAAEMYYKGAFPGIHFGTHPQLGPDVDVDYESLFDLYEEYVNGLQRAMVTAGMTADSLAPQVVTPEPQILIQIEAICMKMRCPKRILMGSERGEQSSIDDRKNWNSNLASRQWGHNTPRMIVPLYDRFINLGIVRPPRKENDGYKIGWADMTAESSAERADILLKRTQAYSTYVQGMETIVPPLEYMTKFDAIPKKEAEAIIDAANEATEGDPSSPAPLLSLVGGVDGILQMFDRFQAKAISEDTLKQLIMLFYKIPEEQVDAVIADGLPEQPELGLPAIPGMKPKLGGSNGKPKPAPA